MAAGPLSYQDLSKKWAPSAFYFWHINIVDKILRKTLKKIWYKCSSNQENDKK